MPVGKKLAAERRSQAKTLAEIVDATKIMGRMLEALENERWEELPAPPYVKGYIQNYAQVLGIDAGPLLEEYQKDIAAVSPVARMPAHQIPDQQIVPHRHELHAIPSKAIIAVVGAVLVVVLALWGISALAGRDDTPPPLAPETTSTPVAPGSGSTETSAVGEATNTPIDVPEGAFALTVSVAPGDSSWVRVLVDGLVAYEGTLPGGEPKSWTVGTSAVIRAGKPTAVTVTRDGNTVEFPPATDGIAEVTLSATEE